MSEEQRPTGLFDKEIIRYRLNKTLQGYIHSMVHHTTTNTENSQTLIIKQTLKELVSKRIAHNNHFVPEDFKQEMRILRHISNLKDCDPAICRIVNDSVWEDDDSYYYTMEFCQYELFNFVQESFREGTMAQFIQNRTKGDITESARVPCAVWIKNIKNIFQQLVRCVDYLHTQGIAHRDLSLENVMLSHVDGTDVKIIDFGVAYDISQHENSWICYDRVGKSNYMAPEVFHTDYDRKYDARAADIWCLGIILFMMLTNSMPINRSKDNHTIVVNLLLKGRLKDVIKHWKLQHFFTDEIIDLLYQIFKSENERITMRELLGHPFVGLN